MNCNLKTCPVFHIYTNKTAHFILNDVKGLANKYGLTMGEMRKRVPPESVRFLVLSMLEPAERGHLVTEH